MEKQPSLFGDKSLNPVPELKRAMALAAKKSGLTRWELAERMTLLLRVEGLKTRGKDGEVTEAMIDKWLAPESLDSYPNPPLLVLYCRAVNSLGPLQPLAAPLGGRVIGPEEIMVLAWAENELAIRKLTRRRKQLEPEV